jgi:thiamine transporter
MTPGWRREGRVTMRQERLLVLVEIALTIALAAVLNLIAIRLPINIAGGKVSLDMLPIIVLGLRRGWAPGVVAGAVFGLADYLMEPFFAHPVQFLLDYPVAFAGVGLAGLFAGAYARARAGKNPAGAAVVLVSAGVLGVLARFAAHFVSGIVFFGTNAPAGQPVWLYSLIYNGSYLLPSAIACIAAAALIVPSLDAVVPRFRTAAR